MALRVVGEVQDAPRDVASTSAVGPEHRGVGPLDAGEGLGSEAAQDALAVRDFDVQLRKFVAAEVQDPKLAEQEKGLWKAGQLIAPKIQ